MPSKPVKAKAVVEALLDDPEGYIERFKPQRYFEMRVNYHDAPEMAYSELISVNADAVANFETRRQVLIAKLNAVGDEQSPLDPADDIEFRELSFEEWKEYRARWAASNVPVIDLNEAQEADDVDPEVWLDQNKDALHAQHYSLRSPVNPGDEATMPHRIVLHHSMSSSPEHEEWVTHMQTRPRDGSRGGYHWGHYTDDYAAALEDFKDRCAKIQVDWTQAEKFVDE